MIVFDLACDNAHAFEGWFRSSDDFADQQARGMLTCPVCDSAAVAKAPMAPAVPAKRASAIAATGRATGDAPVPARLLAAFQAMARAQTKALANSEWVGDRFAAEVRSMHYGDTDEKQVHGRATREEAKALVEEGIPVAPLLIPVSPPDEIN